jgi:enediyne biosynthesis protein E4
MKSRACFRPLQRPFRLTLPFQAALSLLMLVAGFTPGCRPPVETAPPASSVSDPRLTFRDVAPSAGIRFRQTNGAAGKRHFLETTGSGACWLDYDNDGWMDLYVVQNGPLPGAPGFGKGGNCLYHNRGDGSFEDVTAHARVPGRGYGQGACAADVDNDGQVDLFVTCYGRNILYRNRGDGTFAEVTARAGLDQPAGWSSSAAFADYDADGHVDLYVGHYCDYRVGEEPKCTLAPGIPSYCRPDHFQGESGRLFHNDGGGTFTDVTATSGMHNAEGKNLGVVWGDFNDDGRIDLFVANDNRENLLFRNDGNGKFTDVALQAGVALTEDGRTMAGMGTDMADYDNDGRLDLFVANFADEPNELWRNEGDGSFSDVTYPANIGPPSLPLLGFGAAFLDANLDGLKDLVVANGHIHDTIARVRKDVTFAQPNLFYLNRGDGTFADASTRVGPDFTRRRVGRGLAVADYDNDGDPDVLTVNLNGPVALLRNEGSHRNHWLGIRCTGTKANRDGIGARVTIRAGDQRCCAEVRSGSSYLSQNDSRILFGLGQAARVDQVEVRWPGGAQTLLRDIPPDQFLHVQEGAAGPNTRQ